MYRELLPLRSSKGQSQMDRHIHLLPLKQPLNHPEWHTNGNLHTRQGHLINRPHISPNQALPIRNLSSMGLLHIRRSLSLTHEDRSRASRDTLPHFPIYLHPL